MSFIQNTSGPLVLVQGINQNSGQWFGGSLLIFLWMIMLVMFRKSGNQDAFLASSFIISILAGLAFGLEIIGTWQLVFPISMLVASLVLKIWGEG